VIPILREHSYECKVQAGQYQMKVNVITSDPANVEAMVRERAFLYLTRALNSQAAAVLDMQIIDCVDRGAK
jgi:hypothetical protein